MQTREDHKRMEAAVKVSRNIVCTALITSVCMAIAIISSCDKGKERVNAQNQPVSVASSRKIPADAWKAPDSTAIPAGKAGGYDPATAKNCYGKYGEVFRAHLRMEA